ncbi:class E sortase [Modestobacter sp. SYSU DS0290]
MVDPQRSSDEDLGNTQRWERVPDLLPAAGPGQGAFAADPRGAGLPAAPAPAWTWDEDDEGPGWEWDDEPVDQEPAPRRGSFGQALARGVGELLVTAGVVVLLFVVYEVYVTDLLADRRQDQLSQELHETWDAQPAAPEQLVEPPVGEPLGVLHVPRLGADWARVVLQGTTEDELSQGPGHYAGTAMPGQQGNFAVAGHRVGRGSPFLDLDQLQPGDPIVVETAGSWYVYRVLGDPADGGPGIPGQQIVTPEEVSVIAPTPGAPGAPPSGAYLTLTTCHPKYSARQRLIVHAVLDGAPISKAEAPDGPPALAGG